MAAGIAGIDATSTIPVVGVHIVGRAWAASIRHLLVSDALEERVEFPLIHRK